MSREALKESLSAVMDNEADELELRRLLAASDDPQLRSTWSRYQLARAAMHKDLLVPHLDIAAAVSAALADEALPEPVKAVASRGSWRGLGRMAVAASVTVAVLAGVRLYNGGDMAGQQLARQVAPSMLAAPQAQGAAVLTGYTVNSQPSAPGLLPGAVDKATESPLPLSFEQAASDAGSQKGQPSAASLESR